MRGKTGTEPLYMQVKNDIIAKIEQGIIRIGDKLMSENEMMQYYNVGRVTVRTALSALAAMGCVKKEQGSGTFCIAKPSNTQRMNIDVLLNCNDTYLVPFLLAGINGVLEKENCNLLLHDIKSQPQTIDRVLQSCLERGTSGVIVQYPFAHRGAVPPLEALEQFRQLNIPVVSVCGDLPGTCGCLKIDDRYGARIAAQYLLDCGHRNILGLFPEEDFGADARCDSVAGVIAKQPDAAFHALRSRDISADAAQILELIQTHNITAVLCYNDFFAVQCMHILQEKGCRIPEDISLIGFDDSALSTSAVPQLTTVSHPKDHMGSDAARTILHRIRGEIKDGAKTIYRPELVIRQSVLDMAE